MHPSHAKLIFCYEICNILKRNLEFINKYYPKFDIDKKIKPFEAPQGGVQELTANFEASDKLQAIQGGMKQI